MVPHIVHGPFQFGGAQQVNTFAPHGRHSPQARNTVDQTGFDAICHMRGPFFGASNLRSKHIPVENWPEKTTAVSSPLTARPPGIVDGKPDGTVIPEEPVNVRNSRTDPNDKDPAVQEIGRHATTAYVSPGLFHHEAVIVEGYVAL